MQTRNLPSCSHNRVFDEGRHAAERGTRAVMWITIAMMVVEIISGWWFNAMALLADDWQMSSHTVAIGLNAFAHPAPDCRITYFISVSPALDTRNFA